MSTPTKTTGGDAFPEVRISVTAPPICCRCHRMPTVLWMMSGDRLLSYCVIHAQDVIART